MVHHPQKLFFTFARSRAYLVLLWLGIVSLSACGALKEWRYLPTSEQQKRSIYLVNHGWHTGLVIPAAALGDELDMLRDDFGPARFYEIGWGDRGFYQAPEINASVTLKALFWPTSSVLHVVALPTEPAQYFPQSTSVKLTVSKLGLAHLMAYIAATFERDSKGQLLRENSGLYGNSRFYQAKGTFFFSNTCNAWVARGLDRTGVPVRTAFTWTAGSLMRQLDKALERYPLTQ